MQPDQLRDRYRELISTKSATEHDTRYPIDPADPPLRTELRDALGQLFAARPELDCVALVVGDTVIGVVHLFTLDGPVPAPVAGPAGVVSRAEPGSGMLGLPGYSSNYALLYFACPKCPDPAVQALLHLDDGEPPLCRLDPAHGPTARITG